MALFQVLCEARKIRLKIVLRFCPCLIVVGGKDGGVVIFIMVLGRDWGSCYIYHGVGRDGGGGQTLPI